MGNILNKLLGGDLRSIGNANEVISDILNQPILFHQVFNGMKDTNPIIRMRSADVIEKISRMHPEYLTPYKEELLKDISEIEQQEVRWHVALMFTYLNFSDIEKSQVIEKLNFWIESSESKIVIVNSLESLVHIGKQDSKYRIKIIKIVEEAIKNGSPAIVARAKKLMDILRDIN